MTTRWPANTNCGSKCARLGRPRVAGQVIRRQEQQPVAIHAPLSVNDRYVRDPSDELRPGRRRRTATKHAVGRGPAEADDEFGRVRQRHRQDQIHPHLHAVRERRRKRWIILCSFSSAGTTIAAARSDSAGPDASALLLLPVPAQSVIIKQ